jgi:hypothetical protein
VNVNVEYAAPIDAAGITSSIFPSSVSRYHIVTLSTGAHTFLNLTVYSLTLIELSSSNHRYLSSFAATLPINIVAAPEFWNADIPHQVKQAARLSPAVISCPRVKFLFRLSVTIHDE